MSKRNSLSCNGQNATHINDCEYCDRTFALDVSLLVWAH